MEEVPWWEQGCMWRERLAVFGLEWQCPGGGLCPGTMMHTACFKQQQPCRFEHTLMQAEETCTED